MARAETPRPRAMALRLVAVVALAALLGACRTLGGTPPGVVAGQLAASLDRQLQDRAAAATPEDGKPRSATARNSPLLVATVVDVNDLTSASALSRMLAEQVGAELVTRGYGVKELKLRRNVLVDRGGEYLLSRDARKIAEKHDAASVVTGTYALGGDTMIVNMRVVEATSGTVKASATGTLAIDGDLAVLARPGSEPGTTW